MANQNLPLFPEMIPAAESLEGWRTGNLAAPGVSIHGRQRDALRVVASDRQESTKVENGTPRACAIVPAPALSAKPERLVAP
jgi:hypothetical protein